MIRLVLFDIDGTLIRTGGAGVKAFEQTFAREFGLPHATRSLNFAGRTDTSLVRECFTQHGIPTTSENFQRFFDIYPFWLDHMLHQLPGGVCEGVLDFIHQLQSMQKDKPVLGLLTGNIRLGAELKLRRYNLWDRFVTGAFGDDHEDRPQIAAIAHRRGCDTLRLQVDPKEALVIGDTPLDVACAKAIGAKSLAVATGGATLEQLQAAKPTMTVKSLEELSAAELVRSL